MVMTTRKKVLSSALFFVSGMLLSLGIVKGSILNVLSSICGVVIAICCILDGKQK